MPVCAFVSVHKRVCMSACAYMYVYARVCVCACVCVSCEGREERKQDGDVILTDTLLDKGRQGLCFHT